MEQYITNNSLIYSYRNFILLFKTHDYIWANEKLSLEKVTIIECSRIPF